MKKVIYVDMDDVLCNFTGAQQEALLNNPEIKYPQSQCDFYRTLVPLKNGIEVINYLNAQSLFTVYILTAPSVRNPFSYTEKRLWIEDYFGFDMVNRLIISPNKGLNKGDYLIDDHDAGRGQEDFEGELLHFGSEKFKNWELVLAYFKEKYALE